MATLVFFVQIFAAFWKTLGNIGNQPDPSNPTSIGLNRTPHNIAFGALYFWLPFAVLGTAYVGGAQTENSVPRILTSLREATIEIFRSEVGGYGSTKEVVPVFPDLRFSMRQRWLLGGIPVLQLGKFEDWGTSNRAFLLGAFTLSSTIIIIPSLAAILLSWNTPTEGFGCRATTQLSFLGMWLISHFIDLVLNKAIPLSFRKDGLFRKQSIFWIIFVKDIAFTFVAATTLTYTASGMFNSCDCWTKWWPTRSDRYLSFPQEQFVFDDIKGKLKGRFAYITVVALLLEIAIFAFVAFHFRDGHRLLKQRDIEDLLSESRWTRFRGWCLRIIRKSLAMRKPEPDDEREQLKPNDQEFELSEMQSQRGIRPPGNGTRWDSRPQNQAHQARATGGSSSSRSSSGDIRLDQADSLYHDDTSPQRFPVRIGSTSPTPPMIYPPPLPPRVILQRSQVAIRPAVHWAQED